MDDRALKKLAAARDHEAVVADVAADAVGRLEGKVVRIRRDLEAAEAAVESARADARNALARADEASAAYDAAVGEGDVTVGAQAATGKAV